MNPYCRTSTAPDQHVDIKKWDFRTPVGSSVDTVLGTNRTEAGRTPVPKSTFDGLLSIDTYSKQSGVGHVVRNWSLEARRADEEE